MQEASGPPTGGGGGACRFERATGRSDRGADTGSVREDGDKTGGFCVVETIVCHATPTRSLGIWGLGPLLHRARFTLDP
jgi:hypothetical protein